MASAMWLNRTNSRIHVNDTYQARVKALKEQQRNRLDTRHKYVIGIVADRLGLDEAVVEDFLLDGDQVNQCD